jgi:hypothetical protein
MHPGTPHPEHHGVADASTFRLPFTVLSSLIFLLVPGTLSFIPPSTSVSFFLEPHCVISHCLVPLMVILFEVPLLIKEYGKEMVRNQIDFHTLTAWVGGYASFAFSFYVDRR